MAGKGLLFLDLMKFCIDALHLVGERALRASEGFRNLAVRDLRIVETHLNNAVCVRIKLTEACDEVLQQIAVSVDIFNKRSAVRNVIAESTVAVWKRLIQRCDVACNVIFAVDTVTAARPNEAVRAHAPAVILLLMADAVGFLIESVVLRLGDRHLLAGAANVDEIGLLVVISLHEISSIRFAWNGENLVGSRQMAIET